MPIISSYGLILADGDLHLTSRSTTSRSWKKPQKMAASDFLTLTLDLRPTMMKPFSHGVCQRKRESMSYHDEALQPRGLSKKEILFIYRLSRARRVVENAFGILANRFQIFLSTMHFCPSTARLIVKACLVLHNLMIIRYPRLQNQAMDHEDRNHRLVPEDW